MDVAWTRQKGKQSDVKLYSTCMRSYSKLYKAVCEAVQSYHMVSGSRLVPRQPRNLPIQVRTCQVQPLKFAHIIIPRSFVDGGLRPVFSSITIRYCRSLGTVVQCLCCPLAYAIYITSTINIRILIVLQVACPTPMCSNACLSLINPSPKDFSQITAFL